MAASVAHDFNNFLFVILGYAEKLVLESQFTEAGRANLRKISKAAKSAANLARQLLKFSRKQPFEKPCARRPHRL